MKYESIGRLLRRSRRRRGLSQFDVAEVMGCSRAQVDNIEVARQRAPMYRIDAFARAVGLKMIVQIVPAREKQVRVRTTHEMADLLAAVSDLEETDREMVLQLVDLLNVLPLQIRETLRGVITLWADRYRDHQFDKSETA